MANVKVCCRFRPFNERERRHGSEPILRIDDNTIHLARARHSGGAAQAAAQASAADLHRSSAKNYSNFTFDHVFNQTCPQETVYQTAVAPLVHEIFQGYNATIFAYGQTGSGKTHTMMGQAQDDTNMGIIPRLVASIFDGIETADPDVEFSLKLTYVEIYNEHVRDLLDSSKTNLQIRESLQQGVWIRDATEKYVGSYDQVLEVMAAGTENRAIASTQMNLDSSRSHAVFVMTLGQRHKGTGSKKASRMTLVDLAGSEKVSKTGSQGQVLQEAKNINKSLSALGNVINALTCGQPGKHIPYRDSKLTRLLTDSLGGNSKTCLIVTCSPAKWNATETVSTLRFGVRAKSIKNKPVVNLERSVEEYKLLLTRAVRRLQQQQKVIRALTLDAGALREALAAHGSASVGCSVNADALVAALAPISTEGLDDEAEHGQLAASHGHVDIAESKRERNGDDDDAQLAAITSALHVASNDATHARLTELEAWHGAWQKEKVELVEERDAARNEVTRLNTQQAQFQTLVSSLDSIMQEFKVHKEKVKITDREHHLEVERLQAENRRLHASIDDLRRKHESVNVDDAFATPVGKGRGKAGAGDVSSANLDDKASEQEHALIMAFQEKCEQYMNLQLAFQARMEHLTLVETALEETTGKLHAQSARLRQAERVCEELTESGMFWREQRRLQEKKMLATKNIVIPMMGGGGSKLADALRKSRAVVSRSGGGNQRRKSSSSSLSSAVMSGGGKARAGTRQSSSRMPKKRGVK